MNIYIRMLSRPRLKWYIVYIICIKNAHFLTTIRKVNSILTGFIINLPILLTGPFDKPGHLFTVLCVSLTVVISWKIVSGQGQEYSETEQTDPGNSGNASGSGNSSDDRFEELENTTKGWTIGQTGIPEIEYTDIEAERNRISEDIGSGIGSNRRYISPEKKSGSPSETIVGSIQPGNNLRGAASFSSNSGGAIGAWPSNEMTVKVTPMEVIL